MVSAMGEGPSPLERFRGAAGVPVGRWRDHYPGYHPLGIYNAYVPVELFEAAGLTPVYLFHRAGDSGYARAHLPVFCCWPGRSVVDQARVNGPDHTGRRSISLPWPALEFPPWP